MVFAFYYLWLSFCLRSTRRSVRSRFSLYIIHVYEYQVMRGLPARRSDVLVLVLCLTSCNVYIGLRPQIENTKKRTFLLSLPLTLDKNKPRENFWETLKVTLIDAITTTFYLASPSEISKLFLTDSAAKENVTATIQSLWPWRVHSIYERPWNRSSFQQMI